MSQLNQLTFSWQDEELICNPKAEVGIVELGLEKGRLGFVQLQEGKEKESYPRALL